VSYSEDARMLDSAIRDANIRAAEAFYADDEAAYADAAADLAALRDMRLSLWETG
jgi:hypothetical protein